MSDIQLTWPNKELTLRASGEDGYEWVRPTDARLREPLALASVSRRSIDPATNLLVIADGLDALEALAALTVIPHGGIRLVYVDPPFNTHADVSQYSDSMSRPMW